jgi:hypothetical protein
VIRNVGRVFNGAFFRMVIRCDYPGCEEFINLDRDEYVARTTDFEPGWRSQLDALFARESPSWSRFALHDGGELHYCPAHPAAAPACDYRKDEAW